MTDWRIKDYKTICFNLQNKLTPYEASEWKLAKKMRAIQKEKKCDELTAWKILKSRLRSELIKKGAINVSVCKKLRQNS